MTKSDFSRDRLRNQQHMTSVHVLDFVERFVERVSFFSAFANFHNARSMGCEKCPRVNLISVKLRHIWQVKVKEVQAKSLTNFYGGICLLLEG